MVSTEEVENYLKHLKESVADLEEGLEGSEEDREI